MSTTPSRTLETFPNPRPDRDFVIRFDVPEFTCLCPLTGQPDFASFDIRYVPGELCVELKSLKLYFWSFRNEGAFHEKVTNTIADDLIKTIAPKWLRIDARWNVRGGIGTLVVVEEGTRPASETPIG